MQTNHRQKHHQDPQDIREDFLSSINRLLCARGIDNVHYLHKKRVASALRVDESTTELLFLLQAVLFKDKSDEARDLLKLLVDFLIGVILKDYKPKQGRLKTRNIAIFLLSNQGYDSSRLAKLFGVTERCIRLVVQSLEQHIIAKIGNIPVPKGVDIDTHNTSLYNGFKNYYIDSKKDQYKEIRKDHAEDDFFGLLFFESELNNPLDEILNMFPSVSPIIRAVQDRYPHYFKKL